MNYSEEDIMNPNTGKQTVILATDSVFINTKCLFVEYNDVIKCPMFLLTYIYASNEHVNEYFDLSSIQGITPEEMYEFYMNRKFINPLYNFPLNSKLTPEEGISLAEDIVKGSFDLSKEPFSEDYLLNFALTLYYVLKDPKFIRDCRVYTKYYHKNVDDDLQEMYGGRVKYVYGDFAEIVRNVPQDSTYVFSDIEKITTLYNEKKLELNTIILADNYMYNYDGEGHYKVDVEKYSEDYPFKFATFDNIVTHKYEPIKIET